MESLVKIPDLVLSKSLKSHLLYEVLYSKVLEELKKLPNISNFKLSNEITVLVCTLIEHAVKKKNKIDKKKLVLSLLTALFSLSVAEQNIISNQIEYILTNTNLVKRIVKPIYTRVIRKVRKTLFKKEQSK
jgi:hypothetical protein